MSPELMAAIYGLGLRVDLLQNTLEFEFNKLQGDWAQFRQNRWK